MPSSVLNSTSDLRLHHTMGMHQTLHIPYIRYSNARQEAGSSRERQRELAAETNTRKGWTQLPFVEDLGKSAFHGDHLKAELGKLTADVVAGVYPAGTVISAEKIDRLCRQGYDALNDWMKIVVNAGLRVYTIDDGKLYDSENLSRGLESQMVRLMKAEVAREYVEGMQGRVIVGIRKRQTLARELGRPTSLRKSTFDNLPGWLEWAAEEVKVVEFRAEVVRDIYRWSADGLGSAAIASRLNEAGRYTFRRNRPWQPSSIYKLLESPNVEGDFIPTIDGQPGEVIHDFYERIVEADLVKRGREAKARRRSLKGCGPSQDFVNVFAGVTKCGQCGGRLHVQKCKDGKGVVRRYFRCDAASRSAGCDRKEMLSYERFEGPALDAILPLALDDRFFSRPDNTRPLANEVAGLEKLLEDRKVQARRLTKIMLTREDPDPIWLEEQDSIRSSIRTTEQRLAGAQAALLVAKGAADQETHLRRVLEVRDAMFDADLEVAMGARRSVRDAMGAVVEVILSDVADDGTPSLMVALVGGLIGFRVNTKTGAVVQEFDLTGLLESDPQLRSGATSYRSDGSERLDAVLKRRAA